MLSRIRQGHLDQTAMHIVSRNAQTFARVLSLVILAALALAACGPATPAATPSPGGPTPTVTVPIEMPVVVTLMGEFRAAELALLDEQIARFEAANPDILVEIVEPRKGPEGHREGMGQLLAEGNEDVDVVLVDDARLAEYAANGWLIALEDYVNDAGLDMGGFFPGTVEGSTIDGSLVALPWIAGTGLLYYRTDLLENQGLAPPTSWPEVQQVALDLKAAEGLRAGHVWQGEAYESLTCNTLEFVWAFGGEVLDVTGRVVFDSEETRSALQQMSDLVRSGASPEDTASYREGTSLAAMRRGESALMRNWPYAWERLHREDSQVGGQVAIVPLPASCLQGQSLALSAHGMHPEKAFRLMRYLVGADQQVEVATEAGRPPALEAVYADAGLLQAQPFLEALHTALGQARPRPRTAAYPEVSEAIYAEVNRMLAGEQDAGETAARVQQRIEGVLDR
jgi:multiple sugar transport system substrate-binding protein